MVAKVHKGSEAGVSFDDPLSTTAEIDISLSQVFIAEQLTVCREVSYTMQCVKLREMYLGSHHHPIYPSEIYGSAAANAQQNPTDTYRLVHRYGRYLGAVGALRTKMHRHQ